MGVRGIVRTRSCALRGEDGRRGRSSSQGGPSTPRRCLNHGREGARAGAAWGAIGSDRETGPRRAGSQRSLPKVSACRCNSIRYVAIHGEIGSRARVVEIEAGYVERGAIKKRIPHRLCRRRPVGSVRRKESWAPRVFFTTKTKWDPGRVQPRRRSSNPLTEVPRTSLDRSRIVDGLYQSPIMILTSA